MSNSIQCMSSCVYSWIDWENITYESFWKTPYFAIINSSSSSVMYSILTTRIPSSVFFFQCSMRRSLREHLVRRVFRQTSGDSGRQRTARWTSEDGSAPCEQQQRIQRRSRFLRHAERKRECSSSCPSQYTSSSYHSISTIKCAVNLNNQPGLVLVRDPNTGYSHAVPITTDDHSASDPATSAPVLSPFNDYEGSYGYVDLNDPEVGSPSGESTDVVTYDRPTNGRPRSGSRYRCESGQSETTTVSDQGFGSADSDPDSRQVSPTETKSPSFPSFPPVSEIGAKLNQEGSEYLCMDELESICSYTTTGRRWSPNSGVIPYQLSLR